MTNTGMFFRMLFSAVFLLNEPYTCAHHRRGRILYGAMVGGDACVRREPDCHAHRIDQC